MFSWYSCKALVQVRSPERAAVSESLGQVVALGIFGGGRVVMVRF